MKRCNFIIIFVCLVVIMSTIPVSANNELNTLEEKENVVQPRFTNISLFYNDFYMKEQGNVALISSIDARNVDECKINMYLQKYQNGNWIIVKQWSTTESGTFCGIGETYYIISVYQYRMVTYGYVYSNGKCIENTQSISETIIY